MPWEECGRARRGERRFPCRRVGLGRSRECNKGGGKGTRGGGDDTGGSTTATPEGDRRDTEDAAEPRETGLPIPSLEVTNWDGDVDGEEMTGPGEVGVRGLDPVAEAAAATATASGGLVLPLASRYRGDTWREADREGRIGNSSLLASSTFDSLKELDLRRRIACRTGKARPLELCGDADRGYYV